MATLILGLAAAILPPSRPLWAQGPTDAVRFATFNAALNRPAEGRLIEDLSTPDDDQARAIAEIIQRADADVVLINEFDYDQGGTAAAYFQQNYLSVGQQGARPVEYPFVFRAPSNTGIPSGHDLNNDGRLGGPDDAFGYGSFPGQYGMLLLSKHPIQTGRVRTFRQFLWRDMPGAMLPDDPQTPGPGDWYDPPELDVVRLSSKSHWDVPIDIDGRTIHVLAAHPTPPVFDGPEDRNGTRNHDEIRFWSDYVTPGVGDYIYDDAGQTGGLAQDAAFVILGDLNADPLDGDGVPGAVAQLLHSPRVNASVTPTSPGGTDAAVRQGGVNGGQLGDPACDTADFYDGTGGAGNLRVDYVLPSPQLGIHDAGVFWPTSADPLFRLVGDGGSISSDHRLVYVDATVIPEPSSTALLTAVLLLLGGVTLIRHGSRRPPAPTDR